MSQALKKCWGVVKNLTPVLNEVIQLKRYFYEILTKFLDIPNERRKTEFPENLKY